MAMIGVPIYHFTQLMGTSEAMIERHYGHIDPASAASHVVRVFGSATKPEAHPENVLRQ